MTMIVPNFDDAVVVREADAEALGWSSLSTLLLADSNATGGALSVMRTTIGEGTEGARPHMHTKSAELFYVLDGELQILTDDQVIIAVKGDLVVVPPTMAHAFATTPGHTTDFLIVLAPGLERFGYFRLLELSAKGRHSFRNCWRPRSFTTTTSWIALSGGPPDGRAQPESSCRGIRHNRKDDRRRRL